MQIRSYQPADRDSLVSLAARALRANSSGAALAHRFGALAGLEPETMIRDGIADQLDRNADGVLVAEADGTVVGFVITQCFEARVTGWIPVIAVDEEYQRRGFGRALLVAALEMFESRGMKYARLETLDSNAASQRLFAQCGFEEFAREIQYFKRLGD